MVVVKDFLFSPQTMYIKREPKTLPQLFKCLTPGINSGGAFRTYDLSDLCVGVCVVLTFWKGGKMKKKILKDLVAVIILSLVLISYSTLIIHTILELNTLVHRISDEFYQDNLVKFLQQEQAIGTISQYNYSNLTSPCRIGLVTSTQQEWQYWNMVNSKLGKHFER